MAEKHYRSLAKAFSWRVTGGVDTLIITFLIAGKLKWAFYVHELVWHNIAWGKTQARSSYEI